jgi:hypothetical protein
VSKELNLRDVRRRKATKLKEIKARKAAAEAELWRNYFHAQTGTLISPYFETAMNEMSVPAG